MIGILDSEGIPYPHWEHSYPLIKVHGGGGGASQSAMSASTFHSSSEVHAEIRRQFHALMASTPSASVAPDIFNATHVMSSYKKLRDTVSSTSLYYLKLDH